MSRKTRKLIWSAPLVAVLAVALAIFAALSPNWAQAHEGNTDADPPGPVNGLTAGADGYNAIVLKWDPPSSDDGGAPTGYRIDISEMPSDPHVWQFHETIGVNVSGAKHTYTDRMDLSAGNQRRYRVTGFNDAGVGSTSILPSSIVGATAPATNPGPVIRLRARSGTGDDAGSILLSWTEPTDTGGEDIAVYCIVASTERAEVVVETPSADNCDEDAEVPDMRIGTGDSRSIAVSGKSTTYKHSGTFDSSTEDDPPTVTPLTAGATWYYRAYGANSEGRSTIASNIDDARVATGARAATVGAPMDLRVVWENDNSAAGAYWNWPAGHTGMAFQLQRSTSSSFPTTGTTDPPTTAIVEISNLNVLLQSSDTGNAVTEERIIYYRVRAGTDGRWSNTALRPSYMDVDGTSTIIPNEDPRPVIHDIDDSATPDVDEMPTIAPADGENGYTVIEITWTPDLGDDTTPIERPSGYEIDRRTGTGPWQRLQSDTTYTSSEYSDPGLTPGTMYTYRIFPLYSSVRLGGRSMPVYGEPITVNEMTREPSSPDPVRGLTVTADGPTAFNLEWDRVTETGGADVKFYYVQVVDDGDKDLVIDADSEDATWLEANEKGKGRTDATTTEYRYEPTEMAALRGGDVRWFRVFAINQANSAAAGDEDDLLDDTVDPTMLDRGAAEPKRGQTDDAAAPDPPVNLSAEIARDSSGMEVPDRGVLLIWNMPDDPKGATIAHYVVERKIDDGEWEELGKTSDGSPDDRTYINDRDKQVAGELRTYRVAAVSDTDAQGGWSNEAGLMDGIAQHMHNTAPMAEGMIDPVTVTAGMMSDAMDVSGYFTDADTGDTLTYTAMSNMEMYATADIPAGSSMLTITGIAAGSATVTVTATDAAGAYDMQTIAVTVEAADTTPMAPSGVMAEVVTDDRPEATVYNVKVTWTDGANAEAHGVLLFTSDFSLTDHIGRGLGGSHTFENVAAGSYIAVVVVLDAQGGLVTDANGDYLYAGAESTVMVQP